MVANDKRESLDVSARSLARGGGYAALNKDISLYLSRALGVRRRSISQTSFPATTKNKLTARQREDLARGSYCFSPAEFHPPPGSGDLALVIPLECNTAGDSSYRKRSVDKHNRLQPPNAHSLRTFLEKKNSFFHLGTFITQI